MASWAGSIKLSCGISGGITGPPATALVIVVNADVRVEVALVENVGTRGVVKGGAPSGSAAKQMHIVTSVSCCLCMHLPLYSIVGMMKTRFFCYYFQTFWIITLQCFTMCH